MTRRLDPEEEALWGKVIATVRPLGAPRGPFAAPRQIERPQPRITAPERPPRIAHNHAETLDGSWDRRLTQGRVDPQMVIDLHGMSRESARHLLYRRVHDACQRGLRVVLVITGKGHRPGPAPADLVPGLSAGTPPRGGIRAELPRWLGEEGLSHRIAAVRRAHPRHGGDGAAYLILRR